MSDKPRSQHRDVFVSCTTQDLAVHRRAAADAAWRADMFPLTMDKDTAGPFTPVEYSMQLVDEAEIYVGIFAYRYGFVPEGSDKSVTEMEYRRAKARGIPMLIFVMDKSHPITADDKEEGVGAEKIKKLKEELLLAHRVGYFKSLDDFRQQAYQALTSPDIEAYLAKEEAKAKESGEAKSAAYISAKHGTSEVEKVADDTKKKPYIAHDYIQPRQFFGRTTELTLLDKWAASTDSTMIVDAIGGIGKSALTWKWFKEHAENYDGALWWSFYESDGAVENFVGRALAYVTGQKREEIQKLSRDEREQQLLEALRGGRYLLVLDGIERALVAYHRMDAPHVSDDEIDHRTDDEKLRSFTDMRHSLFMKRLAACAPSKILISTRLVPYDLEDASRLITGVRRLHLNGLAPDDALGLMNYLGVQGDRKILLDFMAQFERHSLLLTILAGRINDYPPAPGNFDSWYSDEGHELKLYDLDIKQRRTHILKYALEGLRAELVKLLGQIAAFRYPVDYNGISAFNPYLPPRPDPVAKPDEGYLNYLREELESAQNDKQRKSRKKEIDEVVKQKAAYEAYQKALGAYTQSPELRAARSRFHADLAELENRGLLQWEREVNRYDLHPVVRGYAFEKLLGDDRQSTFLTIRDHFEKLPPGELEQKPASLHDLRRLMEIFHALFNAGLFDEAFAFYKTRFSDALGFDLAAYHTEVELLKSFYLQGYSQPPLLSDKRDQGSLANFLGFSLSALDLTDEVLLLYQQSMIAYFDYQDYSNLANELNNYALTLREGNQLAGWKHGLELCRTLAEAISAEGRITRSHYDYLYFWAVTGQVQAAETAYTEFRARPKPDRRTYRQGNVECLLAELYIWQGKDAAMLLDEAERLAAEDRAPKVLEAIHALRAKSAFAAGNTVVAQEHIQNALKLARQAGVSTARHLGLLARIQVLGGETEAAKGSIQDALQQHSNAFDKAEIYNNAADVWLKVGESEQAEKYGRMAYEAAWADGSPCCQYWQLEWAKRTLDALKVPYPQLPPFDPAQVEKLPYEDKIRALIAELEAKKDDDDSDD